MQTEPNSRECAYRVREKERENLFSVNLIERMIERKFSSAHRVCYSGNRVEWKGEKIRHPPRRRVAMSQILIKKIPHPKCTKNTRERKEK
jgi:hypothetical protein